MMYCSIKKKKRLKRKIPGIRLQRLVGDFLRISFLYVASKHERNNIITRHAHSRPQMYSNNLIFKHQPLKYRYIVPDRNDLEATMSRETIDIKAQKLAHRVLEDAEKTLQVSRENINIKTNAAKKRKVLTEKAKRAFEVADRVARRAASMLTRHSALSTWSSWWVHSEPYNFYPAGRYLVTCACDGDIGQICEILQHIKSFEKMYPHIPSLVRAHTHFSSHKEKISSHTRTTGNQPFMELERSRILSLSIPSKTS